jgi:hypothetical protein
MSSVAGAAELARLAPENPAAAELADLTNTVGRISMTLSALTALLLDSGVIPGAHPTRWSPAITAQAPAVSQGGAILPRGPIYTTTQPQESAEPGPLSRLRDAMVPPQKKPDAGAAP